MSAIITFFADISFFDVTITLVTLCAIEEIRARLPENLVGQADR